jgi:glutaconate CoA-transferase subunit B
MTGSVNTAGIRPPDNRASTDAYTLAELCICAAAEAWRGAGEVLATGITLIPRLAAGLARLTVNHELMMTDGECYLAAEPIPPGSRGELRTVIEGWMPYARTFEVLWGGRRHAMVVPTQVDRFGQSNLSVVGDYTKPKAALLGVRGLPGNSVNHPNSYFTPSHTVRTFVAGEVDMVCGAGYNPARWPGGRQPRWLDLRLIVTDLAVLDFGGPHHQIRVRHLHPGSTFEQLQDNTAFPLAGRETASPTPVPSAEQLRLIREVLDPHDLRASVFKARSL